jgi:arylsulfatase A-like enzyme
MLDAASVLDDTVVVATADHGENLGENHLISHILSLDDRLLRVPLVARGVELPREEVTRLVDVPAMLAAAIGLRDHPWVERASGGVAVAQASSEMLVSLTRELAGAWGVTDDAIRSMGRTMTCATDGRLKLVRDEAGERVYEPGADREESSPLDTVALAREEGAVRRLRQAVDRVLADTVATPEPAAAPAVSPEEAAELEERMRQLGYM